MNEIDEYKLQTERLRKFKAWRSLIGKEYFGGTRGAGGEYGEVVTFDTACALTIYHQEYDGAANYHTSSPDFSGEFTRAAIENAPAILDSVQRQLEEGVEKSRKAAIKIAESILA